MKTTVRFKDGHRCGIAFRCQTCKRWFCGHDNGCAEHEEDGTLDVEAFRRCDDCWTKLERRRARRKKP